MKVVKGACPQDCPDGCAWEVTVEAGAAVAVSGAAGHPFTRGALCAKLKRYPDRVYSKQRLLYPLRRVGHKGEGRFERVGWDTALGAIAERLHAEIANHGPLCVMPCNFAGTFGLLQRYAGDPFFARLGATGLHPDICGQVAYEGVTSTIGPVVGVLPEDLRHSRFIILWATNTVVTNLHQWSSVIRQAQDAGAKIVVIDPVRTRTARIADWHVQPRPGTDAALALGMMHVIVHENLHDLDYVSRYTVGFDELRVRLQDYPPARAAALTDVAAGEITALARAYASSRPAVIRLLVGLERYSNGGMTMRTIACLPALVGAWRDLGGGLCQFTAPFFWEALDSKVLAAPPAVPAPQRMVHLAQIGRALAAKDMDPPISALFVYDSNPLVTSPNQNVTRRGLARDDLFTVVHEQFMTDTARYADYLLPATTQFEHLELMSSWGQTYLALNQPAIAPLGEALSNTELFRRLARAMGYEDDYLYTSDEARIRGLLDSGHPYLSGVTFERLQQEGWVELSLPRPWQPLVRGGFPTPSGKCEFYSRQLEAAGDDPLPAYTPPADGEQHGAGASGTYPLALVSAKPNAFLNSSFVNLQCERNPKLAPEIQINTADAAARNIKHGDLVRVFNDLGELTIRAVVSNDTPAGAVAMPFSWWMPGSGSGASANALTPDGLSDRGLGSNAFDARVEVRAAR